MGTWAHYHMDHGKQAPSGTYVRTVGKLAGHMITWAQGKQAPPAGTYVRAAGKRSSLISSCDLALAVSGGGGCCALVTGAGCHSTITAWPCCQLHALKETTVPSGKAAARCPAASPSVIAVSKATQKSLQPCAALIRAGAASPRDGAPRFARQRSLAATTINVAPASSRCDADGRPPTPSRVLMQRPGYDGVFRANTQHAVRCSATMA